MPRGPGWVKSGSTVMRGNFRSLSTKPTSSLPPQHPCMLLVPLRMPPARAEHRVVRRIVSRRAALDEIGERLGWRAGDVDAVGAQVRDHARARLRLVQLGGQLRLAVPAGVRA